MISVVAIHNHRPLNTIESVVVILPVQHTQTLEREKRTEHIVKQKIRSSVLEPIKLMGTKEGVDKYENLTIHNFNPDGILVCIGSFVGRRSQEYPGPPGRRFAGAGDRPGSLF